MSKALPAQVDALRLADAARRLTGTVSLSQLERLACVVQGAPGDIQVELEFGTDDEGIPTLHATIDCVLQLICQRCLEPMEHIVRADVWYGLVERGDEAERLPEGYEPLVLKGRVLFLADVIEEELLLSLPIVPKHPDSECPAAGLADAVHKDAGEEDEASNPFAVLSQLKTHSKDIE